MHRLPGPSLAALTLLLVQTLAGAAPAPAPALVERLNQYRTQAPACPGQQSQKKQALPALEPDERLARVPVGAAQDLQAALRAAGFLASGVEVLVVSGPGNAQATLRAMAQGHCSLVQSRKYSRVGAAREGNTWQLVLAEPLLDEGLGDSEAAGKDVLQQVNKARSRARKCGEQSFAAAPPLRWNAQLAAAAGAHSQDMARQDHISHSGSDGSSPAERATRAGYVWRRIGENVAAGQGWVRKVVQGWLDSPGHCANIMNPAFREMGAAYVVRPETTGAIFWTQVFGVAR